MLLSSFSSYDGCSSIYEYKGRELRNHTVVLFIYLNKYSSDNVRVVVLGP